MTEKYELPATVSYGDVDGRELMLLTGVFKLLQDAAILHANQFGTGTNAVTTRSESWVLNRIAVDVERYPRAGDALVVETWSSGIKGFKGYRDFRVRDAQNRVVVRASSLWLYISLKTKSIVRVPREVAEIFPSGSGAVAFPELESLDFAAPEAGAVSVPVTLRYSDFDVNEHVNNTAYVDFVQTALVRLGTHAHPRRIRIKYAKAIPVGATDVTVRLATGVEHTRFSIEANDTLYAAGEVSGA